MDIVLSHKHTFAEANLCLPVILNAYIHTQVDIVLSYKHTFAGVKLCLPVILNVCELPASGGIINTGKQVVMKLTGQTLQRNEPYLQLPIADSREYKGVCQLFCMYVCVCVCVCMYVCV